MKSWPCVDFFVLSILAFFVALRAWTGSHDPPGRACMDATSADSDTPPISKDYASRPGALVWFFRKSRDGWKRKHQELKATVKGFKNRIADVTKSREQWKMKAEQALARLAATEAEVARLRAEI